MLQRRLLCLLCVIAFSFSFGAFGQDNWPPVTPAAEQALAKIVKHPPVATALEGIRADSVRMFEEQVRLNEIPAPPFKEEVRAQYYLKKLREAGLKDARIDKEGNVIGVRRGSGRGPRLVISAHLDTVFPEGTDVKVREKGGRYYGPGIGDDAAGLTSLLTMIAHLNKSGLRTIGDIIVVGTVGEEELGDLRGVKALFATTRTSTASFRSTAWAWEGSSTTPPEVIASSSISKGPAATASAPSACPARSTRWAARSRKSGT